MILRCAAGRSLIEGRLMPLSLQRREYRRRLNRPLAQDGGRVRGQVDDRRGRAAARAAVEHGAAPRRTWRIASEASSAGGSPLRFALVTASAPPQARITARAIASSGMRRPIVPCGVTAGSTKARADTCATRTTAVSGPGQNGSSASRASGSSTAARNRLDVVEEHGEGLCLRASLQRREAAQRCLIVGQRGEAVDRIRGDRDDFARADRG